MLGNGGVKAELDDNRPATDASRPYLRLTGHFYRHRDNHARSRPEPALRTQPFHSARLTEGGVNVMALDVMTMRVQLRNGCKGVLASVSIAVAITAVFTQLAFVVPVGASTIGSNESYARAQLLKLSDVPHGYTKSGDTWTGTSDSNNSSSMFTMTQIPDVATCLGEPPELSVVAAEASSPDFFSKDGDTDVFDVADVYSSVSEAKSDFPPLNDPKFAKCFLQVEGSVIVSTDQAAWPTGTTFGTPIGTIAHVPKFGDQSGLVEVQVPVTLPQGQGNTNDFFVALIIRQGRSVAELMIDQGGTTPSAALTNSLAKKVTASMRAKPPTNSVIDA